MSNIPVDALVGGCKGIWIKFRKEEMNVVDMELSDGKRNDVRRSAVLPGAAFPLHARCCAPFTGCKHGVF
jgi:hypothetical protein